MTIHTQHLTIAPQAVCYNLCIRKVTPNQRLELHRSNLYYVTSQESKANLYLMRLLDEEYTQHPFKGVLRMEAYLRDLGYCVNKKRIRRLLRLIGLEAIYPKKHLSQSNLLHKKYPYLLKRIR